MENEDKRRKNALLMEKKDISFDEGNSENLLDPHHGGLVIKLYVSNYFV